MFDLSSRKQFSHKALLTPRGLVKLPVGSLTLSGVESVDAPLKEVTHRPEDSFIDSYFKNL